MNNVVATNPELLGGALLALLYFLLGRSVRQIDENISKLWSAIEAEKEEHSESRERIAALEAQARIPRGKT